MALLFDAATEEVSHGSSTTVTATAYTLIQWLKPSTVTAANRQPAGQPLSSGQCRFMTSIGDNAGALRLFHSGATTSADAKSAASQIVSNTWQCVAFVLDTSDSQHCRIYIGTLTSLMAEVSYDGASLINGSGLYAGSGNFMVGADGTGSLEFEGDIANTLFWPSTALTLAQIQMHQIHSIPKISGCEIYTEYGFNGTATQPDWSGNGNNGTVTGASVSDHVPLMLGFGFDVSAPQLIAAGPSVNPPTGGIHGPLYGPLGGAV